MARPRRVYDPLTGAFDRQRSAAEVVVTEDRRKGEWIGGVFVVSDHSFVVSDTPASITGLSERQLRRPDRIAIRGERIA